MKKYIATIFCLVLVFALSSCNERSAKVPNRQLKVGLLLTGTVNDGGWCQIAYAGLMQAKDELGIIPDYTEYLMPEDMEAAFEKYASEGYDVVIGHGFQFGENVFEVAKRYPDVKFVCVEGNVSAENVASYTIKAEEATYLIGALAASVTKTNKIGMVAGVEGSAIIKMVEAFKLGARSINPSIEIFEQYTGSFEDVSKARASAGDMAYFGADFIAHAANQAGFGAIKAAQEANVLASGDSYDQSNIAPDTVIVSTIYNVPSLVMRAIKDVREGKFKGEVKVLGMSDGIVDTTGYGRFNDKIAEETRQKIAELKEQIIDGSLVVPTIVTRQ